MTRIYRAVRLFRPHRIIVVLLTVVVAALVGPSLVRADAVVTLCRTADDSGPGTNLRDALRAQPDPDTLTNHITFQCGGPATIQVGGPLEIVQPTKIDGGGSVTLIGGEAPNLIVVAGANTFLYLYNLTLHHPPPRGRPWPSCPSGQPPRPECGGRVLYAQGVTELHNVGVSDSYDPVAVVSGSLAVYDSRFTGNHDYVVNTYPSATVTIDHSAFQNNVDAAPIQGGASANITNSQFTNNGVAVFSGGACALTIDRSTFQDNKKGALVVNSCDTKILHTTFTNNSSASYGGAILFDFGVNQITLRADKFLNNSAGPGGGAVFWRPPANVERTISVLYSTFTGNRSGDGGAIDIDDSVNATGKTVIEVGVTSFSGNVATGAGGAINAVSSALAVARGIFADNKATGDGGAVFVSNAPQLRSIFANSLFIRNSAAVGSAFYGDGADFINSTVDSNVGLAIANHAPRSPLHIRFSNSIVSNNPQGGCGPAGLFDDSGHNLQFPSADCGASISVANPHLDTMYIPLPTSPPMGNGDLNVCMSPPINGRDVYGMGRPSGGLCTIGAAEGDIEAHIRKRPGRCPCDDLSLVKQLQRLLPFSGQ